MKKIAMLILSVFILCTAFSAQAEENGLPVFASIRDVIDSTEGYLEIRDRREYVALILETDSGYVRMATLTDDHAKELYKAVEAEEHSLSEIKAFEDYAWALPLSYTEKLVPPKSQAELDALTGKTVQELMDEGFGKEIILTAEQMANPVSISLEYGFYSYEFEVENGATGYSYLMTVKSGKLNGFSRTAFDIDIQSIQ